MDVLENVCLRRTKSNSNTNCCVFGCSSVSKKNPELLYHSFPNENQKIDYVDSYGNTSVVARRKLWIIKLKMGKPVSNYMRVCSRHFVDEDYITPNEDCYTRRYLKKTAVPSQHLPLGTVDQEKEARKNKRFECLMKRRQIFPEEHLNDSVSSVIDDKCLQTSECVFSGNEIEAAQSLLELTKGSLNIHETNFGSRLQSTGTQTDDVEFCFCKKSFASEKVDAEVQVSTKWLSIADFIQTDKALNVLTGIVSFKLLLFLISLLQAYSKDTRSVLDLKERILLVFLKLKLDLTYSALCVMFKDISVSTCKKIFHRTVEDIASIMKVLIYLPSKENILMNTPTCFKNFQNVRIVLDCTEVKVQGPKKLCCRIKLYSHYKKSYTVKFMTAVTPAGVICYVSPSYGGRCSDKSIFEQSQLVQQLIPYVDAIMVDKGFLIDTVCDDYEIKIVRPPFLRKKKQLNKHEATENRDIASARVHIERVNARIKNFHIFRNTFPLHLVPIVDNIFITVCGIVNLSSPVLRDDLFLQ